ncbi:hypothetical protein [Streptomyces sp. NPDC019890]|uniref:hypothetical protein n=1 Tax=Streptomyces sp. NPDC019890 TaxID=3365064 RepID=UPI00384B6128
MSDTTHSDEDLLRRGLHELAESGSTTGPPAVDALVTRGRRTRHMRRATAVCCATVLVAGGVDLGLRLTDHAPRTPDPLASRVTPAPERSLRLGPPDPKIGVKYPYDLVTSCDLRFATFGDSNWVSTTESNSKARWATDHVSGYMTLTSKDTARFEFPPGSKRGPITFRTATGGGNCPINPAPNPAKPPVLELAPLKAQEGAWYPYGLYVHCGLRYATFDSRLWTTVRDYTKETGMDGSGRFTIVSGFAKMSGDTLRFEYAGGAPIEFRPAGPGEKPPMCA